MTEATKLACIYTHIKMNEEFLFVCFCHLQQEELSNV